jgi:ribosomal protein L11 methyltransferase
VEGRYWQLTVVIPRESSATVTGVVRSLGAIGTLDQPLDETRSSLCALFDDPGNRTALLTRIRAELAALRIRVSGSVRLTEVVGGDWGEAWPEYLFPVAIGRRLLVVPPWIEDVRTDRTVIVIEPGGFGTGHHPTTAGCLEALEAIVERERPGHAIDLGTGSGILAIAAARLGVARVFAVDQDPGAITCATANVARNGVGDGVRCLLADATAVDLDAAPLVTANLLGPVHRRLAERYAELVLRGGHLVLGGIEEPEVGDVIDRVSRARFVLRDQRPRDGWCTLVFS